MNIERILELKAQQAEKQELIFAAENALASATHQHENISKLLAFAACPFEIGEIILLPEWRAQQWTFKGVVKNVLPTTGFSWELYQLEVAPLKKDGSEAIKRIIVFPFDGIEEKNGKPSTRELEKAKLAPPPA